jgi:hypothetical protein
VNKRRIFDVIVAGGGASGSHLYEASGYERPRYGETLPPEINPLLRELGLWEGFSLLGSLEAPGIVSAWGSEVPAQQDFISNRMVRAGMSTAIASTRGSARKPRRLARRCSEVSGRRSADLLVDATGRSGLRDALVDDVLLAIALRLDGAEASDLRTIIETTPRGWWYSSPLPGDQIMTMFSRARIPTTARGSSSATNWPVLPSPTHGSRRPYQCRKMCCAPSGRRLRLFGPGWAAVGDSASSYDPLSGRGVFKAIRHGAALAEAIVTDTLPKYAARVEREYDEYVRQRAAFYASEQRWPESTFWLRRRSRGV